MLPFRSLFARLRSDFRLDRPRSAIDGVRLGMGILQDTDFQWTRGELRIAIKVST